VLLMALMTFEGFNWLFAYQRKLAILEEYGGILPYCWTALRVLLLPEICTLLILLTLINQYHRLNRIQRLPLTINQILRYELKLLPVMLVAFFVFNPVTQTVRYLLAEFPNWRTDHYLHNYLTGTFNIKIYLAYLIPVFFMGYGTVNGSLLVDILESRRRTRQLRRSADGGLEYFDEEEGVGALVAERVTGAGLLGSLQVGEVRTQSLASPRLGALVIGPRLVGTELPLLDDGPPGPGEELFDPPPIERPALTTLRGRNNFGEMVLPVHECYWFETEDRTYYALHPKGRFAITKTMNELEAELPPETFFRIRRDCIVNLQYVASYAYWEKGKYIIRMLTPQHNELDMPRARLNEFKARLGGVGIKS